MDYTKLDDEILIFLVSQSQKNAISEIYNRYSRLVFSMAMNALGDRSLAEDITQDVFLRIWEKAHTYNSEQGKVITWIASITRNRSIDVIRRRNIRPEGHQVLWSIDNPIHNSDPVNVESEVELSQWKSVVRKAIAQLPEEQQRALAYAYFYGFSHQEIANLLNEPLGTIKTRIRLAMQKLRQALHTQ